MIRAAADPAAAGIIHGVGDDCAVLAPSVRPLLVSTDTLVEGVHFDLSWHPPRDLGYKSAAVNLSDIAAMGGRPRYLFLSLGLPRADFSFCREFMDGFSACLNNHGGVLAGGDTVRSPVYSFTVTVIGEAVGQGPLKRSDAVAGDEIMVSGNVGGAAAGLELCRKGMAAGEFPAILRAHLAPEPRVALGQLLAETGMARAMIDLSDGIARDLGHVCRASGLGAVIEAARLPMPPGLSAAAEVVGADPLELAVRGGEDYELLFTVAAADVAPLVTRAAACGCKVSRIGRMLTEEGVFIVAADGRRGIVSGGFEHFGGRG